MTFETVRGIVLALPEVEEGPSYGTPGFRVRKKFIGRLREDEETLVVKVGFDFRDMVLAADPDKYFVTDHYQGYPAVLIRLEHAEPEDIAEAFEQAWRLAAPAKLVKAFDRNRSGP